MRNGYFMTIWKVENPSTSVAKIQAIPTESFTLQLPGYEGYNLLWAIETLNETVTADCYQRQPIRLCQELERKRPYTDKVEHPAHPEIAAWQCQATHCFEMNERHHNESWMNLGHLATSGAFTRHCCKQLHTYSNRCNTLCPVCTSEQCMRDENGLTILSHQEIHHFFEMQIHQLYLRVGESICEYFY